PSPLLPSAFGPLRRLPCRLAAHPVPAPSRAEDRRRLRRVLPPLRLGPGRRARRCRRLDPAPRPPGHRLPRPVGPHAERPRLTRPGDRPRAPRGRGPRTYLDARIRRRATTIVTPPATSTTARPTNAPTCVPVVASPPGR